jgi:hypothetical protein
VSDEWIETLSRLSSWVTRTARTGGRLLRLPAAKNRASVARHHFAALTQGSAAYQRLSVFPSNRKRDFRGRRIYSDDEFRIKGLLQSGLNSLWDVVEVLRFENIPRPPSRLQILTCDCVPNKAFHSSAALDFLLTLNDPGTVERRVKNPILRVAAGPGNSG